MIDSIALSEQALSEDPECEGEVSLPVHSSADYELDRLLQPFKKEDYTPPSKQELKEKYGIEEQDEPYFNFVYESFYNDTRKSDRLTVEHSLTVYALAKHYGLDRTAQIAGLFHDIIEDTDVDLTPILSEYDGEEFSARVSSLVMMLTRPEGSDRISHNILLTSDSSAALLRVFDGLDNLLVDPFTDEYLRRYPRKRTTAKEQAISTFGLLSYMAENSEDESVRNVAVVLLSSEQVENIMDIHLSDADIEAAIELFKKKSTLVKSGFS